MNIDKIKELCGGNEHASRLACDLWGLFCVWDDCIDRDKPINEQAINDSFMWAMFGLHDNVFYKQFEAQLKPAIYTCIASWMVANRFEKTNDEALLTRSFVMRCAPYELFGVIALLSSGFDAQLHAVEYFQSIKTDDTLQQYLQEHRR